MGIQLIRRKASREEIQEMLRALRTYIKVAVDIKQSILAGGGIMHADCEAMLLENGSQQENIWGADWDPENHVVKFEALINIRPRAGNRKMTILDPKIRSEVERIVRELLEVS